MDRAVQFFCEKYKEKLGEEEAVCKHLEEYCKFREACIINFMTRELRRSQRGDGEDRKDSCGCGGMKNSNG